MDKVFFSINLKFIEKKDALGIDLYVNASSLKSKEKFVKIFPRDEELSNSFKEQLLKKYIQLYALESDRSKYLSLITNSNNLNDNQKFSVLKESALGHLKTILDNPSNTKSALNSSKESVEHLITLIEDKTVSEIKNLIANLSFHDFYTYDHSINVCMYSISFYKGMGFATDNGELINLGIGALLHDIGKIKVSNSIINKPSKLSEDEFNDIKKHPIEGMKIIESLIPELRIDLNWNEILNIVGEHHENFDGKGYPYQKTNEQIHLFSKICMLADIFDALTTQRSYNKVLSNQEALEIMSNMVGKKIDPDLFKKFLEFMKTYIPKGKQNKEIDGIFDPSVPYKEFEISEIKEKKTQESFGKVLKKVS